MSGFPIRKLVLGVALAGFLIAPVGASGQVYWTDWLDQGVFYGEMTTPTGVVGVTYTGPAAFYRPNGSGWSWDFAAHEVAGPGSRPAPSTDLIGLNQTGTHTLAFSSGVVDPYLAVMSLGRSYAPVTYAFQNPFSIVSEGVGQWGGGSATVSGNSLVGREWHGAVRFSGTFDQLTWTSGPDEWWHGITVGVAGEAVSVPEPGTYLLLLTGMLGMALVARRRNQVFG